MSVSPTVAEVERAKSQTKAAQLLVLDGTNAIADDVSASNPGDVLPLISDRTTNGHYR